jgi:hypothetical protein
MRNISFSALIFFNLIIYNLSAQRDYFHYEQSSSLLIDGNIQGAQAAGVDNSATGQIGFRSEHFMGRWEIKFTAASSVQENLKSDNVEDYSNFILNPFTTRSGLDGLNFSLLQRNFNRKGAIVNYARFLLKIDSLSISDFDYIIENYGLAKNKNLLNELGYILDFNVSNFSWANTNDLAEEGNIVALNPYIIYSYRTMFLGNNVDILAGVGPSFRLIAGNIKSNPELLAELLGTDRRTFFGAQFTVQAFINNFYAKANYALYDGDTSIDGLTGGQFYVSIGLQAKIGDITKRSKLISTILRKDVPVVPQ